MVQSLLNQTPLLQGFCHSSLTFVDVQYLFLTHCQSHLKVDGSLLYACISYIKIENRKEEYPLILSRLENFIRGDENMYGI